MLNGNGPAVPVPVPYRIVALMQERNALFAFPLDRLAERIRGTGFRCARCGTCCTREVNGHIFLLDREVADAKARDPDAFVPAPVPEFCDKEGTFYDSGYAIRMRNDRPGSCWFLEEGRCRIYAERFAGCRIYPYMLRRGADSRGRMGWRQFARMHEHGRYHDLISPERSMTLAREIKEYENAVLTQQISFLETVHEYFSVHGLRHDQEMYDTLVRECGNGRSIRVRVYHAGELEETEMSSQEAFPSRLS
jgi:Fe-S-cluster containining protein